MHQSIPKKSPERMVTTRKTSEQRFFNDGDEEDVFDSQFMLEQTDDHQPDQVRPKWGSEVPQMQRWDSSYYSSFIHVVYSILLLLNLGLLTLPSLPKEYLLQYMI